MTTRRRQRGQQETSIWREHSLTIVAVGIWALWVVLYIVADPKSHLGSFFGNAVADWLGVVITILATKWFFEKDSKESRQPTRKHSYGSLHNLMHEHSLTIFLLLTGVGWVILFTRVDPDAKWGTVVSNIVSEWSQQIGLVLLTKKLIERGSKESKR